MFRSTQTLDDMLERHVNYPNNSDTRCIYNIHMHTYGHFQVQLLLPIGKYFKENSVSHTLIYSDALFLFISIHQGLNGILALIDAN